MDILEKLVDATRKRVEKEKKEISLNQVRENALSSPKGDFPFEKALKKPSLSFICECKKASPSKGLIAKEYPYIDIAKAYEDAGADAISVLTEPDYFQGSLEHLEQIAGKVSIPIIRKDFTIDEYMIYQAKAKGASAILLIMALLDEARVKDYIMLADELGLSALVEIHNEHEAEKALISGARIVGVNNRNLRDFTIDTSLSCRLRAIIPSSVLFVSESGIKTRKDVKEINDIGADALLIGETLMQSDDKMAKLTELRSLL